MSSLLTFDQFSPNYYLISRIIYLSIIFFLVHLRNSKGYEIVARGGGQFLQFKMPVNLTQYHGAVGTFNAQKSIFQRSCKIFFFLKCVNINSFKNYPLSTFMLFVFLFLGLKHNNHKTSRKLFVLFLFLMGFFITHFFLVAKPLNIIKWRR